MKKAIEQIKNPVQCLNSRISEAEKIILKLELIPNYNGKTLKKLKAELGQAKKT